MILRRRPIRDKRPADRKVLFVLTYDQPNDLGYGLPWLQKNALVRFTAYYRIARIRNRHIVPFAGLYRYILLGRVVDGIRAVSVLCVFSRSVALPNSTSALILGRGRAENGCHGLR